MDTETTANNDVADVNSVSDSPSEETKQDSNQDTLAVETTDDSQSHEGEESEEETAEWKDGDPFHKHPDWVKREEKLRAAEKELEELKASKATQEEKPVEKSATKTDEQELSEFDRSFDERFGELPEPNIPEIEYDDEGNITKQPFETYKDMYKSFRKQMVKDFALSDSLYDRKIAKQQEEQEAKVTSIKQNYFKSDEKAYEKFNSWKTERFGDDYSGNVEDLVKIYTADILPNRKTETPKLDEKKQLAADLIGRKPRPRQIEEEEVVAPPKKRSYGELLLNKLGNK